MNRRKAMSLVLGAALSAPVIASGSRRAATLAGKGDSKAIPLVRESRDRKGVFPLPEVTSRQYAKAMGVSQAEVIRRFSPALVGGEIVSGSSAAIHLFPDFQTISTEGEAL